VAVVDHHRRGRAIRAIVAAAAGSAGVEQLTTPAETGIFAGTVIQMLSVITALVAGIIAARRIYGAGARESGLDIPTDQVGRDDQAQGR